MNTLNIAKGAAATHQRRRARATTIPRHGNMGGTLPSAATQVGQDQGRVDEAVLAAEEKQPSPPAEGPGCNPGPMSQRWTFVSRRKSSKLDDIDSRSLIIWGVPYDISAATVHQELLGRNYLSSACVSLWRGTGTNRHVVLAFTSALWRWRRPSLRSASNSIGDQWTEERGEHAKCKATKRPLPAPP